MKLDILAFGAHPDDVEIDCGGTLIHHVKLGYKIGIVDITDGGLGTRGNPEIRANEAQAAAKILGIQVRQNLALRDGFFTNTEVDQIKVIEVIRKYRPEIVIANAKHDRHPDHGRAGHLVADACFLAGLTKIVTEDDGEIQEAWRPGAVYHYIQYYDDRPDFVVDISSYIEQKMKAVKAHTSQFHNPDSDEPETLISSKNFLEAIYARNKDFGREIYAPYAEGFKVNRAPGITDLLKLK